jgi:ABC-2 type transport system permease protein
VTRRSFHPLAAVTLWRREVVRFVRQPSRVGAALGSPLIFWLLLGFGFSGSFHLPGAGTEVARKIPRDTSFLAYFYPGTLVLVVLFAAIFTSISVIEDRREGFLQGVLAAPVSALDMAAGKVAGSATLAWIQGLALLVLAPLAGIPADPLRLAAAAGVLALLAITLTSLGFVFAWRVESVQGFHAVMNLLLIPLWLLSGAFFPVSGAPPWLAAAMRINPLTWSVDVLRQALDPAGAGGSISGPLALGGTCALTLVAFLAAVTTARRGRNP